MLYQFIICGWKNTNIIFTKIVMIKINKPIFRSHKNKK